MTVFLLRIMFMSNTDKSKNDCENAHLLTHLLGSTLSPELRRKAEEKLILLIDRLITE